MTDDRQTLTLSILDKDYQISCPSNQAETLKQCAHDLDQRMRVTREEARVTGIERVAVMTALNVTHELMEERKKHERYHQSVDQYIEGMRLRVDEAMVDDHQLELPTN